MFEMFALVLESTRQGSDMEALGVLVHTTRTLTPRKDWKRKVESCYERIHYANSRKL